MLNKLKQLLIWTWRSWPLLCIFALIFAHYQLICVVGLDPNVTNKNISFVVQLVGGLLVLYSIDSTIGIITGSSLRSDFINYLKHFPLIKRNIVVQIDGAAELNLVGHAVVVSQGLPASVEDQIKFLHAQIEALRKDTSNKIDEVKTAMREETEQRKEQIESVTKSVREVETKFSDVSLSGVKIQLLGIMLLIYGSVTNYVA